jgi:hypothetical protein
MSIEALKHALETLEEVQMAITTTPWMNRRIEELRAAILQVERQEPMAWFTEDHREDKSATTYSKKMSERWKEKGWPVTPLYTAPPQREWQGLVKGVRVDGDNVIVFAGNNDAARHLCGELLKEKSA